MAHGMLPQLLLHSSHRRRHALRRRDDEDQSGPKHDGESARTARFMDAEKQTAIWF
jgi:hypothetical protein